MQCVGLNKKGKRCGWKGVHVNENGYCKLHDPRALLCGHATKSGSPCKLLATECPHHGEHRIPMSDRTEPSIFRVENLRFDKWDAVKEYRDGLDVYSNMKVGEVTNQDQQVDHVTELHVIRDNFDLIQKQGTGFQKKKQDLANLLRSNIVNEVENLNTTTAKININKCEAIQKFQAVYLNNSRQNPDQGAFEFLFEDMSRSRSLSRTLTKNIQSELYKSWEAIDGMFEDEQPLQGEFQALLHKNIVAMKLK